MATDLGKKGTKQKPYSSTSVLGKLRGAEQQAERKDE
jgi:hypothetical protein